MALQIAHAHQCGAAQAAPADGPPSGACAPPRPRIFDHELYAKGATWDLSTSHLPTPHSHATGFHPVVSHGVGVTYQLFAQHMVFTVSTDATCAETSSARFREEIEIAITEMHRLLVDVGGAGRAESKL